jgi:hypothetical protein
MTQLIPMQPTRSREVTTPAELESLAGKAQSVAKARSIIASLAREEPCTLADADTRIRMPAALNFDERMLDAVSTHIAEGRRPASRGEIGKCLMFLEKAFYNSRDKGEVSGALVFDEVVIAAPGVLVLESAVRKLWRTLDWFPSIAQILKAIREEEAIWQYRLRCVSEVPDEHAQALARLKRARARLARTDEEREAERQERLDTFRRLTQQLRASAAQSLGKKCEKRYPREP